MFSTKYPRLHHFHLKKTGGTSFNRWLDTLASDETTDKARSGRAMLSRHWQMEQTKRPEQGPFASTRALFFCADVLHTHVPVRRLAPPGTLCCTFLRDPVQRLLSQIRDFRRLTPDDTAPLTPEFAEMIADTRHLTLRAHLERYGQGEGRLLLDNYMTRSLAAVRMRHVARTAEDAGTLLGEALASLEEFDLVGLTESLDLGRNALCAIVGLPPSSEIEWANRSPEVSQDVAQAGHVIEALTRFDRIVYARASALFAERHRAMAERYDTAAFETQHASLLLDRLRGELRDGGVCFSVRSPITGSGFHGRDAAGTPNCAVWSGPGKRLTLYMPTPSGVRISLLLWIRGYAAQGQRDQIRVSVDGRPAQHCFAPAPDYADLLVVDTCPARDFVRLEIDIDETLTSAEANAAGQDDRKRGFCFDGYGWRM